MNPIIQLDDVTKRFASHRGLLGLRGRLEPRNFLGRRKDSSFTAIDNVSLEIQSGESLGIIGRNGSGKSTLLSLIAGITLPTSGRIQVLGRVASLLELGAGFNPVLTGRENIYLNAGLLGMRHAQVDAVFDEIVRFSGIEEFIDQPVATYSSGMYVRIGFSVAAFVNPDIFLADEVLAVGDEDFQRKCRRKIGELREQGKTILFVSHDLSIVNTLCERVILLDKGKVLQRDTAQKTIMYYLRQVGKDQGMHTFQEGVLEAIKCDGRLSLFHNQNELSAPIGFYVEIQSLGRRHFSGEAEWKITYREASGCRAEGKMMRLPVKFLWELKIENSALIWDVALEVEQDCDISTIDIKCFLPLSYALWMCGHLSGSFPDIQPGDTSWNVVAAPEINASDGAALPEATSPLPPIVFQFEKSNPFFGLFWANTDYMTGCRVLDYSARFPESEASFTPGIHKLASMRMMTTVTEEEVQHYLQEKEALNCGRLQARFENGRIRLVWDGKDISAFLHGYSSMLISYLWNDSNNLAWKAPIKEGDKLLAYGKSRRFPFSQEWELSPRKNALGIRIWLHVDEEFEVQEYHFSLVLQPEYTTWATDTETGSFPDFDPDTEHWAHLNRSYEKGSSITASSETQPTVVLSIDDPELPLRQTVLNTSYNENARVLQTLCPSGQAGLRFTPGRHLYFSGSITLRTDP
ncbi:MAG: ABC transporter ATP-binding protein [Candidatus Hydrogenedens sp.]|jgi:ABC-type polysaccharide/polyol phosphate transport system ATPase subunit|nr:ABC transporter ATP-binding protein [Candidatus Hydrogenedens sp.]